MKIGQFLSLSRIPTLAATAVPIMVGGALGYAAGGFDALALLDIFIVALLMQVATNAFNEYGDYRRAVDTAPGPGFAGVIVSREVSAREVLGAASACYAAAFVLGVALVLLRGVLMLLFGGVAILSGVLYSEGPLPISSTPFGEVAVGLVMGVVEVVSTELAASGVVTSSALVYAFPVSLTVMAILVANNVRDMAKDSGHGRKTLVVFIGRERGRYLLFGLVSSALLWSIPAYLLFSASASVFLVWVALPPAVLSFQSLRHDATWRGAVPSAAKLHMLVGALLTLSIFLHV